jgi:hypothetical protein
MGAFDDPFAIGWIDEGGVGGMQQAMMAAEMRTTMSPARHHQAGGP